MRRNACWVIGLGLVAVSFGCSQSKTGGDGASAAATTQDSEPKLAVQKFLEAVRSGNDEQAAAMLTPVARQKTAENNMVVAPPGSDTASFKVGEVEMIEGAGAHVASFWTDIDDEGKKHTDTIVWMVRKLPEGWRIAGMATRVDPGEPAVVLNFEEPEDMIAQQQAIESQMTERAKKETEPETANVENPVRPKSR